MGHLWLFFFAGSLALCRYVDMDFGPPMSTWILDPNAATFFFFAGGPAPC